MDYQELGVTYTREDIILILKQNLSQKRFDHVLRVEQTALVLAEQYQIDKKIVSLTALLHDYGKERADEEYLALIAKNPKYHDLTPYGNNIWHGFLGALIVRDELKIYDERILHAIQVHTTGSIEMNLLDKIIFIADYIEPGRDFPGVETARKLAYSGKLDDAIIFALTQTLQFLITKKQIVYPYTIEVYNYWITKKEREEHNDK